MKASLPFCSPIEILNVFKIVRIVHVKVRLLVCLGLVVGGPYGSPPRRPLAFSFVTNLRFRDHLCPTERHFSL